VPVDESSPPHSKHHEDIRAADDDWGFSNEGDSWGFEEYAPTGETKGNVNNEANADHQAQYNPDNGEDEWGWGEDDEATDYTTTCEKSEQVSMPSKTITKPKIATRLEKLSAKAKGFKSPSLDLPSAATTQEHFATIHQNGEQVSLLEQKQEAKRSKREEPDTYTATDRILSIGDLVQEAIRDINEFLLSDVFHNRPQRLDRGKTICQAPYKICDTIITFLPSVLTDTSSSKEIAQWSSDLRYLAAVMKRLYSRHNGFQTTPLAAYKWQEAVNNLEYAQDRCLNDAFVIDFSTYYNFAF
jgi:hypothetical protein